MTFLDSNISQRVAGVGIPVGTFVDLVDLVPVGLDGKAASKQANVFAGCIAVGRSRSIVGVTHIDFGNHFTDDETKVRSRSAIVDHFCVVIADGFPIDAVHVGVVEEVTFDTPRVHENLFPLFARINRSLHARRLEFLFEFLASGRVDQIEVIATENNQFLVVGGDAKVPAATDDSLFSLLLIL